MLMAATSVCVTATMVVQAAGNPLYPLLCCLPHVFELRAVGTAFHLRDAGVVLMHSTPNGIGGCPQALKRLISYYKAAGYKFVTVRDVVLTQLIGHLVSQGVADMRAQHC